MVRIIPIGHYRWQLMYIYLLKCRTLYLFYIFLEFILISYPMLCMTVALTHEANYHTLK